MKAKLGPILIALLLILGWRHFHDASPVTDTAHNNAAERPALEATDAPAKLADQAVGIAIPNSLLTQEFLNFFSQRGVAEPRRKIVLRYAFSAAA